jgi:hypothetical protein
MTSCCTEPESRGTCSSSRESTPPPSGAPDVACVRFRRASLRQCGGCAAHTRRPKPPRHRWGCHSPCPGSGRASPSAKDAASIPSSDSAARSRPIPACPAESCSQVRWRPRRTPPAARHRHRPGCSSLCRVCRDLSGFFRHDPPQTRLAKSGIGALPSPLDGSEFVARFDQFSPDAPQHAAGNPALESAVNGGIVSKLPGQMIPLTSAWHLEDDAVQRLTLINAWPAGARLRPVRGLGSSSCRTGMMMLSQNSSGVAQIVGSQQNHRFEIVSKAFQ